MDQAGFRGPQVCGIVGITYRQLDYWDRTGLSRPSLAKARGSGSQRLYSYRDLLELKVIKQLLDGGVNLRQARRAIECLRESVGEDLTSANLVIAGEGSVLVRTGEEIIDLLRGGQGVFNVVPLAGVVGEVDAAILRIDDVRRREREPGCRYLRRLRRLGTRGNRRTVTPGRGRLDAPRPAPPTEIRAATARRGAVRTRLRAPVRRAARLLRGPMGVRAGRVRARLGP